MTDVLNSTLSQLSELLRTRRISPVELVESHIRHIEKVNPFINALVADRFDAALAEARRAEQVLGREASQDLPPLFGLPCTIKDFYAVEGLPQTGGLTRRRHEIATVDAVVVQRLRSAGAIVLGVTNVPEGGLWLESDNRVYGRTNNPLGCVAYRRRLERRRRRADCGGGLTLRHGFGHRRLDSPARGVLWRRGPQAERASGPEHGTVAPPDRRA